MKKIIFLLPILILLIFTGCSRPAVVDSNNTSISESKPEITDTAETTEEIRSHKVPVGLSFDGAVFNILYPAWSSYNFYYFADEMTGDVMNDSIYGRKTKIEEALDMKFTQTSGDTNSVVADVKKSVRADDNEYSYVLLHSITGVSELSSSGMLYNWDNLEYIDYSADWWNRDQMDVLKLGKNSYFGVNDFIIPNPYVIYFNKSMVNNYKLADPYQAVYDNEWVLDLFITMCQTVSSDINGDGIMNENDQYGVGAIDNSVFISFMPSADQMITKKNDEGKIELSLNTPKTISIVEKIAALKSSNAIYPTNSFDFDKGLSLFFLSSASWASSMRDYNVDFGIIPYPKYDSAQENYRSHNWAGLCGIPSTIDDPGFVGAVSELLAFESGESVLPVYYDLMLAGKLSRDSDSRKMFDIAFKSVCYEIGGNYFGFSNGFKDLFYTIPNLAINKGSTDFASYYAKAEIVAEKTINDFYNALDEYE